MISLSVGNLKNGGRTSTGGFSHIYIQLYYDLSLSYMIYEHFTQCREFAHICLDAATGSNVKYNHLCFQQMLMCLFISIFEAYIHVKLISADFAESANLSYASCRENMENTC